MNELKTLRPKSEEIMGSTFTDYLLNRTVPVCRKGLGAVLIPKFYF